MPISLSLVIGADEKGKLGEAGLYHLEFFGALFFTILDLSRSSTRRSIGNCQHQNHSYRNKQGAQRSLNRVSSRSRSSRVIELFRNEGLVKDTFQCIRRCPCPSLAIRLDYSIYNVAVGGSPVLPTTSLLPSQSKPVSITPGSRGAS